MATLYAYASAATLLAAFAITAAATRRHTEYYIYYADTRSCHIHDYYATLRRYAMPDTHTYINYYFTHCRLRHAITLLHYITTTFTIVTPPLRYRHLRLTATPAYTGHFSHTPSPLSITPLHDARRLPFA